MKPGINLDKIMHTRALKLPEAQIYPPYSTDEGAALRLLERYPAWGVVKVQETYVCEVASATSQRNTTGRAYTPAMAICIAVLIVENVYSAIQIQQAFKLDALLLK